jgi:hypothetical protein
MSILSGNPAKKNIFKPNKKQRRCPETSMENIKHKFSFSDQKSREGD